MAASHRTVRLVLLVSVMLMVALAIWKWVGGLPIAPGSQRLVVALVLLTRS